MKKILLAALIISAALISTGFALATQNADHMHMDGQDTNNSSTMDINLFTFDSTHYSHDGFAKHHHCPIGEDIEKLPVPPVNF